VDRQLVPDNAAMLLELAVDLGMLDRGKVDAAIMRQSQLKRGGIALSIGQTLIERRFITPSQLKTLTDEQDRRRIAAGQSSQKAIPVVAGKMFGPYELLATLSEKGHSRVFKARDTTMDRMVVLKVLPKSLTGDKQWGERFRREVQLAGKLSHPNIITAYGAGEVDGNPWMAFEFIDGRTLEDRLEREGNLPERVTWLIAREVAKGLAYAAESGVLHRDIKPENIMCGNDGKVKIIDMGFSKSLSDSSGLTADGTTVGTPFYISPEQAHGTKDLDPRTDLYSLGCTVYHMLTGSPPFFAEHVTDVMLKHTNAPRPDPRETLPEISEGSAKLVMRLMATSPNDRPSSAAVAYAEIQGLLPKLPEPEAMIRPIDKVAPSEAVAVQQQKKDMWVPAAPPPKAQTSKVVSHPAKPAAPAPSGGFLGWLKRIFGS
jgi:serine/threonine protein kinase